MKKRNRRTIGIALGLLASFVGWTIAVSCLDIQHIGPNGSSVGFAALNGWFHQRTGVHMALYTVTDWLGLVPVGVALGFAILGLVQWIQRRSIRKVDPSLILLGVFYVVVIVAYLLFESVAINDRPVLIDGNLEASYPSSTTLLVLCVMLTAMMQLNRRISREKARRVVLAILAVFTVFMVIGRLISGVHWLTDIVGGVLLGAGLVVLYGAGVRWCTTDSVR